MKANLPLRGVDVYINGGGIRFEKEKGDWILPFHEGGVIPFAKCPSDDGRLDRATVEKTELLTPVASSHSGRADESTNLYAFVLGGFDFEKATGEVVADESADAFA